MLYESLDKKKVEKKRDEIIDEIKQYNEIVEEHAKQIKSINKRLKEFKIDKIDTQLEPMISGISENGAWIFENSTQKRELIIDSYKIDK